MTESTSVVIEAAVAAGTLALAILTVYQLRLLVRERRENRARELADKIYAPLRKDVAYWLERGHFGVRAWRELEEKEPFLIRWVDSEIVASFEKAQPIDKNIGSLSLRLNELVSKASFRAREQLGLGASSPGSGQISFRVLAGNNVLHSGIYVEPLWLSGKTLIEYATEYMAGMYPRFEWEFDLQIDGQTRGGMKEAVEFGNEVLKLLEEEPLAREMREKVEYMRTIGAKVLRTIDQEITKASGHSGTRQEKRKFPTGFKSRFAATTARKYRFLFNTFVLLLGVILAKSLDFSIPWPQVYAAVLVPFIAIAITLRLVRKPWYEELKKYATESFVWVVALVATLFLWAGLEILFISPDQAGWIVFGATVFIAATMVLLGDLVRQGISPPRKATSRAFRDESNRCYFRCRTNHQNGDCLFKLLLNR